MAYNGWSNYETWNVALWCDNERAIYMDRMRQKPATAEDVESFVREWFPHGTPDMQEPYESREAVNWQEIADNWQYKYEATEGESDAA